TRRGRGRRLTRATWMTSTTWRVAATAAEAAPGGLCGDVGRSGGWPDGPACCACSVNGVESMEY
ncbi:hypothetical protein LTR66_014929, partial [Elasticomyces elasticus]